MERSFDDVYQVYGSEVHGYLARLLCDPWAAEEVCQETFVRYLAHERALASRNGSLKPWLYRVATNLGIDRLRRRSLRKNAGRRMAGGGARIERPEGRDLEARIRREVEALPPDLRATFLLRAHHGLSFRDVASALSISDRAAKERFRKTRDLLARRLKHLLEESDS